MKRYITTAIALLAFSTLVTAQDIISRATTIVSASGAFYLVDSTLLENGTPWPDLEVKRTLLGDTSQVASYLKGKAIDGQTELSRNMALAMKRSRVNTDFNNYRNIYDTVTGGDMLADIENTLFQDFNGSYRVFDLVADSSFVANVVRVGADQRVRLEHATTGQRWPMLLLSPENFRLMGWNSQNIDLYYDGEARKNGVRVFEETRRVEGTQKIRIAKIRS